VRLMKLEHYRHSQSLPRRTKIVRSLEIREIDQSRVVDEAFSHRAKCAEFAARKRGAQHRIIAIELCRILLTRSNPNFDWTFIEM
jgi:hypothetical protein